MIDTIAAQMHKHFGKLYSPHLPVIAVMKILGRYGNGLPTTAKQVMCLNENKQCGYSAATQDFGFAPGSFEEAIKLALEAS